MNDCVFCKIVRRELPAEVVYEDDQIIAFLNIKPLKPGHTLVIPKQEMETWLDLPTELTVPLLHGSQVVAKAIEQAFPSRRVALMAIGLDINHTHFHLVPIDKASDLDFTREQTSTTQELRVVKEKIINKLNKL